MTALRKTAHKPRSVGVKFEQIPAFATETPDSSEWDEAVAIRMQSLRRRGSGINLRTTRPTSARMARILKLLGLTGNQHTAWCGWSPKDWLKHNPQFSEREWTILVAENYDRIKAGE